MMQQGIWSSYLDPITLKAGKAKCPCCKRPMKAYGYNLDDRLVLLAFKILEHCFEKKITKFNASEVFLDKRDYTQFQKLKCFHIIERAAHPGWWRITEKGAGFLFNKIALPTKVWVFDDQVVLKEDETVFVSQVTPRWKTQYEDWVNDYVLQKYQTRHEVPSLVQ